MVSLLFSTFDFQWRFQSLHCVSLPIPFNFLQFHLIFPEKCVRNWKVTVASFSPSKLTNERSFVIEDNDVELWSWSPQTSMYFPRADPFSTFTEDHTVTTIIRRRSECSRYKYRFDPGWIARNMSKVYGKKPSGTEREQGVLFDPMASPLKICLTEKWFNALWADTRYLNVHSTNPWKLYDFLFCLVSSLVGGSGWMSMWLLGNKRERENSHEEEKVTFREGGDSNWEVRDCAQHLTWRTRQFGLSLNSQILSNPAFDAFQ